MAGITYACVYEYFSGLFMAGITYACVYEYFSSLFMADMFITGVVFTPRDYSRSNQPRRPGA